MDKFKKYSVSFAGLSLGKHHFDFSITQSFFDLFEFEQDFQNPDLKIELILDKNNNFLDLFFKLSGEIELHCDLTNEVFSQEIEGNSEIIVKFGEDFDDSDDEVWEIPQGEHSVSISQMIYEMTLLAIPNKRVHPDVLSGKSHSEMLKLLEQYTLHETDEEEDEEEDDSNSEETIDPRWESLKKLKKQ